MEPGPVLFSVAPAAAAGGMRGPALRQVPGPGKEQFAPALVRTFWWVGLGDAGAPTEWAVWNSRKEEA